ncbi:glycosyl hydrolase family 18 protein [Reichenbachiella sp.]|uniref:glycosyl hydrolase family 18 protein n=1 Tax=Reichenbachiella sp. TaxID=2184521 RepID=UPI003BAE23A3
MIKNCLSILMFFLSINLTYAQVTDSTSLGDKPIVAVYPVWKHDKIEMSQLPWQRFTHLAIASIYPKNDGNLYSEEADRFIRKIVTEAHEQNKKVIISVGGAGEGSKGFLSITSTSEIQRKFIERLIAYIDLYDLDGIDIDWEYWTFQNEKGKGGNDPIESKKLLDLLIELNKKLPQQKLLTVDIMAGSWVGEQYLSEIQNHVDFVNLMAYDFTGAWHNSSIKHHSDFKTYQKAIDYVLDKGFENKKLIVGIPSYGIEFINGKNKQIKHLDYRIIVEKVNTTGRDINKGKIESIYYETPKLVKKKVEVINQLDLAGAMLFEVTADSPEKEYSLLKVVRETLN